MARRPVLEKRVQREIEAAIGAEPDLLLFRNSVGVATFITTEGKSFKVPYGLGVGSPDLVGILRYEEPSHYGAGAMCTGRWFALEVKAPGEKPTQEQMKIHDVWRGFGAFVAAVDSVEGARRALARARKGESS